MSVIFPGPTIRAISNMTLWYRRSGGADFGAQYAMADPKLRNALLITEDHTKERAADLRTITYGATVQNVSSTDTHFDFIVGGLT